MKTQHILGKQLLCSFDFYPLAGNEYLQLKPEAFPARLVTYSNAFNPVTSIPVINK